MEHTSTPDPKHDTKIKTVLSLLLMALVVVGVSQHKDYPDNEPKTFQVMETVNISKHSKLIKVWDSDGVVLYIVESDRSVSITNSVHLLRQ